MDDSKWERWGAIGGILFAVLVTVSALLPGEVPATSDSAKEIGNFIADKGDEIRWSAFISGLAVIALFWWLGSVYRLMRRGEGNSPRLAIVALAGAVFAAVMATIAAVILAAIPIIGFATEGRNDDARTFYILSSNLGFATEVGLAVFLGAFSAVIIRSRVLPAAWGWLGAVIALVTIVGSASVATTRDAVFTVAFTGFMASTVWVLIISVLMLRGTGETAASDS